MNGWKVAFLTLSALILTGIIVFIFWISSPLDETKLPVVEQSTNGHTLTVKTTKKDFEGIANTYIREEMKGQPLPVLITVEDQINLTTELTIFSIKLPVIMKFDPIVEPDGNLRLKQSSVEVGKLEIPPESVLKLLRDSVSLPKWMIVRPDKQDVYIDLSRIPMKSDVKVKAKEFNLKQDEITLEIIVPNN